MRPLLPWFDPVTLPLFEIPGGYRLELHGFTVMLVVALLVGGFVAVKKASRDGFSPRVLKSSTGWLLLAIFGGGHLGHALFYDPEHYLERPWELLFVWEGLSSFGGFAAATVLLVGFFRRRGVDVWGHGDAVVYGVAASWFFARLGCFLAHDHRGLPTDFWLGVQGLCDGGATTRACHDLGLYECLLALPLFGMVWWLERHPRPVGFYLGLVPLLYAPPRFFLEGLRVGDVRYFGFTPGQYGSVVLFLLGAWVLWVRRDAPRTEGRARKGNSA